MLKQLIFIFLYEAVFNYFMGSLTSHSIGECVVVSVLSSFLIRQVSRKKSDKAKVKISNTTKRIISYKHYKAHFAHYTVTPKKLLTSKVFKSDLKMTISLLFPRQCLNPRNTWYNMHGSGAKNLPFVKFEHFFSQKKVLELSQPL